jgi:hypothetical protein
VNLLVCSQLQHLVDLLRAANSATANLDTIADKSEGVDVRELATIGSTNLDQSALGLQQRNVTLKRHLSAGYSRDDQIQSAAVVLGPVLVVISSDVSVGTKLEDFILLSSLTRDTDDLVSSKSFGEEDTEVTKTTNTNNTDLRGVLVFLLQHLLTFQSYLLARSTAVVLQWRVDSDTTTQHWSCLSAVETLRDVEDEVTRMTGIGSVSTITLARAILVLVTVCVGCVGTVVLVTILAVVALAAAVRLSANTDYRTVSDERVERVGAG